MNQLHPHKRRPVLLWILLALAVIPVFYLHLTALRAADDFYYSTFWMNGPAEFWQLTMRHYERFNGRALVHAVAQTVLAFPPVVFALTNTVLLMGIGFLGGRLQGVPEKSRAILWAIFFFLLQLLLLPTSVITQGLLWASASYNYMLPVFLTLLALWLLHEFLEEKKHRFFFFPLFLLAQLAAGATTEQSGIMAVAATGIYGLCWVVRHPRDWWKLLPAPLLAAAGWLTIFFSPATQRRVKSGSSLDVEQLEVYFSKMTQALFSPDGMLLPLLLAAVLVVTCLLVPSTRKKLGRATLSLLVGGLAATLVMLPTDSFDFRTMVPTSLMLLLVSARCAVLLLGLFKTGSHMPLLCGLGGVALCITISAPLLAGVTQNYALELENRNAVKQAQQTGVLHYSMDYDTRWCYPRLMYTESSFYQRFLQANGVEDCTVYLESNHMKPVYLGGKLLSVPGYETDGKVFFSLRDIIEGYGGTVTYQDSILTVTLDGRVVFIHAAMELIDYTVPSGPYQEISLVGKSVRYFCKSIYTADVFRTVWGINIRLDGDRYVCER